MGLFYAYDVMFGMFGEMFEDILSNLILNKLFN